MEISKEYYFIRLYKKYILLSSKIEEIKKLKYKSNKHYFDLV